MIKVKNVDDKSMLHKFVVPCFFVSGSGLSSSYNAYFVTPYAGKVENFVINPTVDVTGSNGTVCTVTNKADGTVVYATTIHSQIATQLDWSANSPQVITPISALSFSAGTPFSVVISGTVGVSNFSLFVKCDINDKLEK